MGYSIRTDRYRYTEWLAWNGSALAPARPLRLRASELYDHDGDDGAWTDPDGYENVNIVATAAAAHFRAERAAARGVRDRVTPATVLGSCRGKALPK